MIACGRDILYVWELALAVSNTLRPLKLNDWNDSFTATVSSAQRERLVLCADLLSLDNNKGLTSWQPSNVVAKGFSASFARPIVWALGP